VTVMRGSSFHIVGPVRFFFCLSVVTQIYVLDAIGVHPIDSGRIQATVSPDGVAIETRMLPQLPHAKKKQALDLVEVDGHGNIYPEQATVAAPQPSRHESWDVSYSAPDAQVHVVSSSMSAGTTPEDIWNPTDGSAKNNMRKEKKRVASHDSDLEEYASTPADTTQLLAEERVAAHLSIPVSSSLLDLGVFRRIRTHLENVSAGTIAVIVLCSFVAGGLFVCLVMLSMKAAGSRPMRLLNESVDAAANLIDAAAAAQSDDNADWRRRLSMEELVLPTTEPYIAGAGNYRRIPISVTANAVETMLAAAHVDFTEFNVKRDMESVLWRLLRAECFFMLNYGDGTDVLLMIETVRIRWVHKGLVLVQQKDHTFLGATRRSLPGIEKPGSEAPIAAAKRIWDVVLKMTAGTGNFIEDSMEDREMVGYKGLRCVERSHVIEVKLNTDDPGVLEKVGLPGHSDFSTIDPQDGEAGGNVERKFKWMTQEALIEHEQ